MSQYRRRLLYAKPMPRIELTPSDYIQDGLVFQLDGIEKGSDNTRWTDLVGNKYFTLTSHSAAYDNYIRMDGSGYISQNSAAINVLATEGTIEVCVDREAGSVVYIPNVNTYLSFMFGSGGFTIRPAQTSNQFTYGSNKTGKLTTSFNWNFGLVNGKKLTSKGNNNWNKNTSVATIGGRNNGTAYYYTGKIYAIRIYNRQLTEEEMRHNQHIDNVRFNLGLDLT